MTQPEAPRCETILRSLPEWFGIEDAIASYRRDLEAMETWVAEAAGEVVGFITLREHNPHSSEIQVMAVARSHQGAGVGRSLVSHAERILEGRMTEYLQVKTLGLSCPNAEYERTRGFYGALGFRPLEENHLWGDRNPCLILVKHLRCVGGNG